MAFSVRATAFAIGFRKHGRTFGRIALGLLFEWAGATKLSALEALAAEKRELEARRERLELPAIEREMLSRLVDKFEELLAEGTNPQIKAPSPPYGEEGAYP